MFRTATPFGYLFITFFLLAVLIAGIALCVRGWRRRSLTARWLVAGVCAFVVIIVVANSAFDSALEWNPTVEGNAQVVRTWTDGAQTITLAAGHTFAHVDEEQTARGTWTRDDWNLNSRSTSDSRTMRFIQFRGQYRLVTRLTDDPDARDGDLGLQLAQHSRNE